MLSCDSERKHLLHIIVPTKGFAEGRCFVVQSRYKQWIGLTKRKEHLPGEVNDGNTSLKPEICRVGCLEVWEDEGDRQEWELTKMTGFWNLQMSGTAWHPCSAEELGGGCCHS